MKAALSFFLITVFLCASMATIGWDPAMSSTSGAPGGYTGSPDDGKTCGTNGGCHGGGAKSMTSWISSDVPAAGYTPGNIYNITAKCVAASSSKFGFEVSPQSSSGSLLGSLILSNTSDTKMAGSKYVTHTSSGSSGNGSKTWTFQWKAPQSGTGKVIFYGAFNATNSNNATTGDSIFTSTLTVNESLSLSLEEAFAPDNVTLYPNPCSGTCIVFSKLPAPGTALQLFDRQGTLVLQIPVSNERTAFNVTDLPAGIYFFRVNAGSTLSTGKLVVY